MSDHDVQLFRRLRDGDARARAVLVTRYLPLAKSLARRHGARDDVEDLLQVASEALLKAIDRFDPRRGPAFATYAIPTIVGELRRHARDRGWQLRLPRAVRELAFRADAANQVLGADASVEAVAAWVGTSVEEVRDARAVAAADHVVRLDASYPDEDDGLALGDVIGYEDRGFADAEASTSVSLLLSNVPALNRQILRLRFEEDLTQREIGERLGTSQMHVSRLIRRSLERLQEIIEPQ